MLDYDGTLAPFRDDPALAVPYPGVREWLRQIQDCARSRLVFISGRRAHEVQRLLEMGDVEIWGCHGLEKLSLDGTLHAAELDAATRDSLGWVGNALAQRDLLRFTEVKPTGYAVHWRGMPVDEAEGIRQRAAGVWEGLGQNASLRRLDFDGGIEICASAMNKGDVVRRIAAEFPGRCAMAYLGDDVTDEDAFRGVRGRGIGILVREVYRETSATAWLRPPEELLAFLRDWINAIQRR